MFGLSNSKRDARIKTRRIARNTRQAQYPHTDWKDGWMEGREAGYQAGYKDGYRDALKDREGTPDGEVEPSR